MFSFHSFAPLIMYTNGYTMMMVDLLLRRQRTVGKNPKNPAIFAISVMLHRQPPFDGRMFDLPPIWLIVAVLSQ